MRRCPGTERGFVGDPDEEAPPAADWPWFLLGPIIGSGQYSLREMICGRTGGSGDPGSTWATSQHE